MKRLVTLAACLATLTLAGCSSGVFGGGLFSNICKPSCNSSAGTFGSSSLLSDGPLRQFMRGAACDACNGAAGQVSAPTFGAPQSFGTPTFGAPQNFGAPSFGVPQGIPQGIPSGLSTDPFATIPTNSFPTAQPATSFFPPDAGVSLGQPVLQNPGVSPVDPGSIEGIFGASGLVDGTLADPPLGIN